MATDFENFRQHIVGRQLSAVTFVMDYVQLQFDPPPGLNALTPITVCSGERTASSGDESFRNLLCEQIAKIVASVSLKDEESLSFTFEDGSIISLSLRPEDYVGPEAVNIFGAGDSIIVI
jgi:hypothetical protein